MRLSGIGATELEVRHRVQPMSFLFAAGILRARMMGGCLLTEPWLPPDPRSGGPAGGKRWTRTSAERWIH